MKRLEAANDNLDERTREVWEPRLGRELSADEARQLTANMTGFFSLLTRWSHAEAPSPANDNEETGDHGGARHDR